jgi:hypothetical protein
MRFFILATPEKHKNPSYYFKSLPRSSISSDPHKRTPLSTLQEYCKKEDIVADKTSLQLIAQKVKVACADA